MLYKCRMPEIRANQWRSQGFNYGQAFKMLAGLVTDPGFSKGVRGGLRTEPKLFYVSVNIIVK